tara:strand:+ start:221 stop:706 length:486 start_codon:yes stop_codon:yes gene_type:complete
LTHVACIKPQWVNLQCKRIVVKICLHPISILYATANEKKPVIKLLSKSEGATIGIQVGVKIDKAEEEKWIVIFDKLLEEHRTINVLVLLDGEIKVGLDVVYEDLMWTLHHISNINKLGFVSSSRVLKWLVAIDSPFAKLVGMDEKYFTSDELQDAWDWVKQ